MHTMPLPLQRYSLRQFADHDDRRLSRLQSRKAPLIWIFMNPGLTIFSAHIYDPFWPLLPPSGEERLLNKCQLQSIK